MKNQIMKTAGVAVACTLFILGVLAPDTFMSLCSWNNGALCKLIIGVPIIVYFFELIDRLKSLRSNPIEVTEQPQQSQPVDELVDFIIENNGLPVTKTREKFGRSGERCKAIGDQLEKRGILKRGQDNARVLAETDPQVIEFGLTDCQPV